MRISPAKSSVSRAVSLAMLSSRTGCDAASSSYSSPAFALGQQLRKQNSNTQASEFPLGGYHSAQTTAPTFATRGFSSNGLSSSWGILSKYLKPSDLAPPTTFAQVQTQVREFNKHKNRSGYYPTLKKTWDRELPPEVDQLNLDLPDEYTITGTITEKYKKPDATETEAFAVIELAGKQYKVVADDLLFVDRRSDLEINDIVECHRVLLVGTRDETVIGRPYIDTASVTCCVESQFMEEKKIIFKKKRRKGYRRNNSFRHRLTRLRILNINI